MSFIQAHFYELALYTWQQIYLVFLALMVALIIGVPLGLWIARREKSRAIFLSVASILQTIPSLALLALLLPFLGIGVKPAVVALSVYALLPIIRNTVTGINQLPEELLEAANGLGFTRWQRLWLVEIPLAMPVIIAGVRTATAMAMGIATLAAFIGAGGLGNFIYQGLSLSNMRLVLLGAIPAAILALLFDYILSLIEKWLAKRPRVKKRRYIKKIISFVVVALLVANLLFALVSLTPHKNTIVIGTKDFTEQYILGELMAQLIQAKTNLHVVRKFNLGGTVFCHEALLKGEIDVYPEYTGTAYLVILNQQIRLPSQAIYFFVQSAYNREFNLTWLKPFGFNNTQAVAINDSFADANSIKTISDLVPFAPDLVMGVSGDCLQRADCLPGLVSVYNINFKAIKLMSPGLMYAAVAGKQINAIVAFSTDGRIQEFHLNLLVDDKNLFPAYYAAPVIRSDFLKAHPEVASVLNLLQGKITDNDMREMNYEVDVLNHDPKKVAYYFLKKNGLLP